MATTGRPRTPTRLALLQGMQRDRINLDEAQPTEMPIEPPPGVELGEYGRWEWDRLIADLKDKVNLSGWDIQTFVAWCVTVDAHWTAAAIIRAEGMMIEETVYSKGEPIGERYKVHPAWKAYQDTLNQMIRLSARYGFSPADRASLAIAPTEAKSSGEDLLTG